MQEQSAAGTDGADPTGDAAFGRRRALRRMATVAGAALAGGALLHPDAAGATAGTMFYGQNNDAGGDMTHLASSAVVTLSLANTSNASVLTVSGNGAFGYPVATVICEGTGDALFIERDNYAVAGAAVNASQSLSGAVYRATSTAPGNAEPLYQGEHQGVGTGVAISLTSGANSSAAVDASTVGTGPAIHGTINNASSGAAAVRGDTEGTGPAVFGASKGTGSAVIGNGGAKARGAVLISKVAQMRLQPGTGATHPKSGLAGDLYVDQTARMWFCKGGTSWKQLA